MSTVGGLLLAAGGGSRYGMPKALAAPHGEPLVQGGLRTLREAWISPIVVVLGAGADQVRTLLANYEDLLDENQPLLDERRILDNRASTIIIENTDWPTGMGSSLRAGLHALESLHVDAAIVLLVDMPGITPAAVSRVAFAAGNGIDVGDIEEVELGSEGSVRSALVAATYGGVQSHPVVIGRDHWDGVAATAMGDVGARPYLKAHAAEVRLVACDDVAEGFDLDEPPEPSL